MAVALELSEHALSTEFLLLLDGGCLVQISRNPAVGIKAEWAAMRVQQLQAMQFKISGCRCCAVVVTTSMAGSLIRTVLISDLVLATFEL